MDTRAPLRQTALSATHRQLGARMGDFGGWEMPIEYEGGGVLKEHQAVRERVGLFDVSHLGTLLVTGPGAAGFVDSCLTNSLDRIAPGGAQYTMCCDENGGVVDDLIIYLYGDDGVMLVPNAANTAEVQRRLEAAAPQGITVTDQQAELAILAVQGPLSAEVLQALALPTDQEYMHFTQTRWNDAPITVCRTGYTGEHGYELIIPDAAAPALWEALLAQVRDRDGLPAGLGARDTLRTEMAYPLHGHELTTEVTPVQAGASWAVGWSKPAFWGREALLAEREQGPARRARALLATGRGIPRADMDVVLGDAVVGRTTSGTFSPTLGQGIALALLDASVTIGAEVEVDVRGRRLPCTVVKPPFVHGSTS